MKFESRIIIFSKIKKPVRVSPPVEKHWFNTTKCSLDLVFEYNQINYQATNKFLRNYHLVSQEFRFPIVEKHELFIASSVFLSKKLDLFLRD